MKKMKKKKAYGQISANEICYQFAPMALPHIAHGTGISIISTLDSKFAIVFILFKKNLCPIHQ